MAQLQRSVERWVQGVREVVYRSSEFTENTSVQVNVSIAGE